MSKRSYDSGALKRKRKAEEEAFLSTQRGALLNYVTREPLPHSPAIASTSPSGAQSEDDGTQLSSQSYASGQSSHSALEVVNKSADLQEDAGAGSSTTDESLSMNFNWKDPGFWPFYIGDKERVYLVEKGPFRDSGADYPQDETSEKRRFSRRFFFRKLRNGDCADRRWLVYSNHKNGVFCFCCRLFSDSKSKLAFEGNSDWKNMSNVLTEHESSVKHILAVGAWVELENKLKEGTAIDKEAQKLMQKETQHWNNVLEKIISIMQFLAERNLAFRVTVNRLFQPNNGNFLGLVELLGKYDSCLNEHLRCIKNDEIHDHYLGNIIQNEIINLIGEAALKKIINNVQQSKYYSIILDCTSDAGHQEQMTMILRICNISSTPVEINEYFVGFLAINDSTGSGLAEECIKKLDDLNLRLENCRGQGYDNGANMKGCNRGVQKRLLELNPKSFYVPCGCHSLNLVLG